MQSPIPLQSPGAGLPFMESLAARYVLMPVMSRLISWDESVRRFQSNGERILALIQPLDSQRMEIQVLIPRLTGIEDSSRFWSAAMTMEHLIITGTAMVQILVELSHGRVPPFEVDIAKVKPQAALSGSEAPRAFREFLGRAVGRIEGEVGDRASTARLRHPWFGPITAHQWNWLMAVHQGIHRRQIEEILDRL